MRLASKKTLVILVAIILLSSLPQVVHGEEEPEEAILFTSLDYPETAYKTAYFNITAKVLYPEVTLSVSSQSPDLIIEKVVKSDATYYITVNITSNAKPGVKIIVLVADYYSHYEHCEIVTDPITNETRKICFEENKHYRDTRALSIFVVFVSFKPENVTLPFMGEYNPGKISYMTTSNVLVEGADPKRITITARIYHNNETWMNVAYFYCYKPNNKTGEYRNFGWNPRYKFLYKGEEKKLYAHPLQLYVLFGEESEEFKVLRFPCRGYRLGSKLDTKDLGISGSFPLELEFVEEWANQPGYEGAVPPLSAYIYWNITFETDAGTYSYENFSRLDVVGILPLNYSIELTNNGTKGDFWFIAPMGADQVSIKIIPLPYTYKAITKNYSKLDTMQIVNLHVEYDEPLPAVWVAEVSYNTSLGLWANQFTLTSELAGLVVDVKAVGNVAKVTLVGHATNVKIYHDHPDIITPQSERIEKVEGYDARTFILTGKYNGNVTFTIEYDVDRAHFKVKKTVYMSSLLSASSLRNLFFFPIFTGIFFSLLLMFKNDLLDTLFGSQPDEIRFADAFFNLMISMLAMFLYDDTSPLNNFVKWAYTIIHIFVFHKNPDIPVNAIDDLVSLALTNTIIDFALSILTLVFALFSLYQLISVFSTIVLQVKIFGIGVSFKPLTVLEPVKEIFANIFVVTFLSNTILVSLLSFLIYMLAIFFYLSISVGLTLLTIPHTGLRAKGRQILFLSFSIITALFIISFLPQMVNTTLLQQMAVSIKDVLINTITKTPQAGVLSYIVNVYNTVLRVALLATSYALVFLVVNFIMFLFSLMIIAIIIYFFVLQQIGV